MKFIKNNNFIVDENSTYINLKDSMTFICDDDEYTINDISENCLS
jgi:hypothetical protein